MSTPEEQHRHTELHEMARALCAKIDRCELTSEQALQIFETLQALVCLLSVPPRAQQH
jgi:hypothetical protein